MKRLIAILLCNILHKMKVSVAINVVAPDGRLIPQRKKIAIAINSKAKQFESWNYGRYLQALCDKDSCCRKCDFFTECPLSIEFGKRCNKDVSNA